MTNDMKITNVQILRSISKTKFPGILNGPNEWDIDELKSEASGRRQCGLTYATRAMSKEAVRLGLMNIN